MKRIKSLENGNFAFFVNVFIKMKSKKKAVETAAARYGAPMILVHGPRHHLASCPRPRQHPSTSASARLLSALIYIYVYLSFCSVCVCGTHYNNNNNYYYY